MMEFLKKNWSKLVLSIGALVLTIVVIIPLFSVKTFSFIGMSQVLGFALFFLGIAIYYVLKMLDLKKLYTAIALIATGVLATTFLAIGLAGFSEKENKQEGAFGGAYAYYRGLNDYADNTNDGAKAIKNGLNKVKASGMGVTDATVFDTVSGALEGAGYGALVAGIEEFGMESMTVGAIIATMNEIIDATDDAVGDTKAAFGILLSTYIALMLALGLGPIVKGGKKLCCAICNKDE